MGQAAQYDYKVIMTGLNNSGKTQILYRLFNNSVAAVEPTHQFNLETIKVNKKRVQVWDISGTGVQPQWHHYCAEQDGIVFVIDAADATKFEEAKQRLQFVLQTASLAGKPLLILCNKCDQPRTAAVDEILRVVNDIRQREVNVCACSAHSGEGLDEAIQWLVGKMRK